MLFVVVGFVSTPLLVSKALNATQKKRTRKGRYSR